MTMLQAFILGIIQGATEFLPISSSGHLVLAPYLFGWSIPHDQAFVFDVLVQIGTLFAVIVYFWRDLWAISQDWLSDFKQKQFASTSNSRLGWLIIVASIPAGVFGILLKDQVEKAFSDPLVTGFFLFGTAALLFSAERLGSKNQSLDRLTLLGALWIGIFQSLAIFPGISRSGATITGGMTKGLDRKSAARFSFLMSIPIMFAAGILALLDLLNIANLSAYIPILAIGFITAAVVGYISIRWLLGFLTSHSLYGFAIYCLIVGLLTIVIHLR
jgi:undecaprenyl-diphosphatase